VSFRRYLLWERLNKALSVGFGGATWTEAAYAANFADSAHLSRTCQRMFGLAPTRARIEPPNAQHILTA
jgi:AraC-like DNA-binding protein